jgi:tryptophan 7-halogenase
VNGRSDNPGTPLGRIVICGGGLAAHLAAAALARQLPRSIKISWVKSREARDMDLFYGGVSAPSAYSFNLSAGLSEPRLILGTDATFSWGTRFDDWGASRRSWVQCFHLPFAVVGGLQFHQHLLRLGVDDLDPLLLPAMAARRGVFAHPVEKAARLLSRAEYGYQLDPYSYREPFAACASSSGVEVVAADVADVECREGNVAALRLADGRTLSGDLFIDCTGPDARLLTQLGVPASQGRRLKAVLSYRRGGRLGPPCRTVAAREFGWQSETSLQRGQAGLTMYAPEMEAAALAAHAAAPVQHGEITVGRREVAWQGNCVALGHAAGVIEPLTHAPMLMLQREIERLLTLIPVSLDMSVERREFNRQSAADHLHAENFHRALFETQPPYETGYWLAARAVPLHETLTLKLTQFASRGLLVAFDLEPFNAEDWTIQHFGMGRRATRYDRIADQQPSAEVRASLESMSRDIEKLVTTLPAHGDYMANLVRYLKQKQW